MLHQTAFHEGLHDGVHVHAANLFHLGARDRLAIGDDGQRFQRRLRQPRRPDFLADQRLEPRRVFGLGNELPRARDAGEPVAARGGFVFARQLFQRGGQFAVLDFRERLGRGVSVLGCSAAAANTSRSSFTLSGFCAENRSDSKINFNSMLI